MLKCLECDHHMGAGCSRALLWLQYESTAGAVYGVPGCVDTLVELLTIYRGKGAIFTKTCTLIGILAYDQQRRQVRTHRTCCRLAFFFQFYQAVFCIILAF
jgi:hypothetical protein